MKNNNLNQMKNVGNVVAKIILNLFFIFLSVLCIFPLIWMFYSGLKTPQEFATNLIALPARMDFSNWVKAIEVGKLGKYFINNLYVTPVCVILTTVFSFIVAYFLNRFHFRFRKSLYLLFLMGMMTPVHGVLVPLYIQFTRLGLADSWYTLFFPITAFSMPLVIIMYENFLNSVPYEVEESAMIDGASLGQRMILIAMPMCKPIIITMVISNFLSAWNEYTFALVLITNDKYKTLALGLSNFQGQRSTEYTLMLAALTIVTIPVLFIYFLFSNKIMEGMTAGAIKG